MDCKQSEILIMQHFEKTIKPKSAQKLAKHVLVCENCRELYLMLDEAMEFADGGELSAAPDNFTENVMAAVRAEAPYKAAKPSVSWAGVALRVVWGVGVLILGAILMFILYPDSFHALANRFPVFDTIVSTAYSFGTVVGELGERLASGETLIPADNLAATTLMLLTMAGTLLYVLHNGEKAEA